jgi:hypothetical protein
MSSLKVKYSNKAAQARGIASANSKKASKQGKLIIFKYISILH